MSTPNRHPYAVDVGNRLRTLRQTRRLSLADVEVRSKGRFPAVVVGSYERGDRNVTVGRLHDLCELYGATVADVLPDAPSAVSDALQALSGALQATGWTHGPAGGYRLTFGPDTEQHQHRGVQAMTVETDLTTLGLPVQAYNALRRNGINTIADLTGWTAMDLLDLRMLGLGCLSDIEQALTGQGRRLTPCKLTPQVLSAARRRRIHLADMDPPD